MLSVLRMNDYQTNEWSGGETTQLYIYPETANLADRDFTVRISIATVNLEESEFSDFSGYQRFLQVLEGNIDLEHEGIASKHLPQFDYDYFSGDIPTTSKGRCRDFNVIYTPDVQVTNCLLSDGEAMDLKATATYFFMNPQPSAVTVEVGTERITLGHLESVIVADEAATLHVSDGEPLVGVTMRMPKERA